jgi:hypothetical protein
VRYYFLYNSGIQLGINLSSLGRLMPSRIRLPRHISACDRCLSGVFPTVTINHKFDQCKIEESRVSLFDPHVDFAGSEIFLTTSNVLIVH